MNKRRILALLIMLNLVFFGQITEAKMSKEANKLYLEAINFESSERYTDAIDLILKALNNSKDDITLLTKLAGLYARNGEIENAVSYYKKAIEMNPNLTIAWINISSAYFGLAEIQNYKENIDKAKGCAMKATNIGPENALAWVMLGYIYEFYHDRNAVDNRIICYKKAVTLDPKSTVAWHNLGNAYRIKMSGCKSDITYENYRKKSINCYQKVIDLKPRDNGVWWNLAMAYEGDIIKPISINNYIKMIDCYRKAMPYLLENKIGCDFKNSAEGNHKKQIEEIRRMAANTALTDVGAWNMIAIELYLDGDYNTAIKAFKYALEKSGGNETIKENLNMVRNKSMHNNKY